jgi:hypothetical protein
MSKNKNTPEAAEIADAEQLAPTETVQATANVVTDLTAEQRRPPSLGDIVQVLCAPGHTLRTPDQSAFFSETELTTVTVDTRIYRLIGDGDLIQVTTK